MEIEALLRYMVEMKASDMHLKAMRAPLFRLGKKLVPCGEEVLTQEDVERMLHGILSDRQREQLREKLAPPSVHRRDAGVFHPAPARELAAPEQDEQEEHRAHPNVPDPRHGDGNASGQRAPGHDRCGNR